MAITLHSATVPVCQHMLGNLLYILDKAEAWATERKIDPAALTTFRLAPDLLPFTRLVLIACDAPKLGVARVTGLEAPKFDDTETTFAELKGRVQKTIDFLASVTPEAINGLEDKEVTFPVGREKTRTMKAEAYLKTWAMPNMFFHITTAYAILRHNGVPLGKGDYLVGAAAG